jgi:hypothetical protein
MPNIAPSARDLSAVAGAQPVVVEAHAEVRDGSSLGIHHSLIAQKALDVIDA